MAQKLKLHSPVGAEALVIKWPVATSEGKEGPEEIVDTIRLVCEDFPELTTPLATRILKHGEDVSSYDYEQTKSLCDRYNKAIDSLHQLVKGSPRSKQFSKRASRSQLKHILQQCYNQSVKDPEKLNQYQPFSPGVYGETSFELVEQMIKYVKFSESDYFIDLGSGVGQVVLQVSAATDCKFCYGIEKAEWPAEYALAMEKEFAKWMKWYGKEHGKFLIEKGDFLHDEAKEKLSKATIVFVNNFAFGPKVDHELKQKFANCLKEGARIVSSKEFCPLNFRITERNLSDIGTIMQVEELSPLCGAVSWTGKPFAYYVHTIDRTLLEKYFQRLKNPNRKDEVEPRKDRKGRPVMSIKDKINGALSGASDSNSNASSRWRRSRNQDSHSDTASPLPSTAVKMLDFDSCSNSSHVSSVCAVGGALGHDHDQSVVYGPTTRRQWNEYVKRPQSHSPSGTENSDSSNGDGLLDQNEKNIKSLSQKRKKMKTVKRLNNGVLGKRQLKQKQGHKQKTKEPESVNSKAAFKLRPRQKQVATATGADVKAVKATSGLAAPTATTNNHHHKPSPHAGPSAQPPSLDSLNLLHAHTIMSTSGKESVDSVHYNDRRMTETSSAYFKPTVQKQTVSMLEKQAGFLDMIENMKQRFLSFLTFMQSPQYRAMLLLQIEQEKAKNAELKVKAENLEKDISVLQKDGLGLIKDRLKEMGIKAETPCELLSQAKDIVLSNKELQAQTASLGAQINALQAEHDQKVTMHKKALDKNMASKSFKNGVSANCQLTSKQLGQAAASQRVRDQHHKLLLANVDRLHAELQQLQDVNRSYTRPQPVQDENGRVRLLSSGLEDRKGTLTSRKGVTASTNCFVLKEKLDMKENYDTFGEVLSTLKQEMDTVLSTQTQLGLQVKSEPAVDNHTKPSSSSSSKAPGRHQATGKDPKNITYKTTSSASLSGSLPKTVTGPDRIVVIESSSSQSALTPVASSSWITQSNISSVSAKSSPRILPAGMKIDIKKPCKVGANGIKSPPVSIARGKIVSAKPITPTGFTRLQESSNAILHTKTNSTTIVSPSSGESYTDNEKSAAEDLISLKEGLSCNNSVSLLLQQQPQLQQFQHPSVLTSNSFIISPSTSATTTHSPSLIQSPAAGGRVVTISKQQNSKTVLNNQILSKIRASQSPNSRSRHASNSSRSQSIIISESSPILYAHTLMPTSLFSAQQQDNSQATSAIVDLSKQQLGNKPGLPLPSSVKIVSSLQHNSNTSRSSSTGANSTKHRALDNSVSADEGPSSPKFRSLQPKIEGTKLSSLLASPTLGSSSYSSLTTSDLGKSRSTVRHLLASPSISGLSISSTQPAGITTIASTTPSSTDLIPYVAIQTPHNSLAAAHATQGTNGAQPALLKLLQQQNNPTQHVVLAPKATPNVEPGANTNSSILGSRSSVMSALPTTVVNQAASDHKGQAVKLIPSNGLDGKGCVQCSEYGDQSVVALTSLHSKGIFSEDNNGRLHTNECHHVLNSTVGREAISKATLDDSTLMSCDNQGGSTDENGGERGNDSKMGSPSEKAQDPSDSKPHATKMPNTKYETSETINPVPCSSNMPNVIEVSSEKEGSNKEQMQDSKIGSKSASDDKGILKNSKKFTKIVHKPSKNDCHTEKEGNSAVCLRERDSRSTSGKDLIIRKGQETTNLKVRDDCSDKSKSSEAEHKTSSTCDDKKLHRPKVPEKIKSLKSREPLDIRVEKRSSSSHKKNQPDRKPKSSVGEAKEFTAPLSESNSEGKNCGLPVTKVEPKDDYAKLKSKDKDYRASPDPDKSQPPASSEEKRSYEKAFRCENKSSHESKSKRKPSAADLKEVKVTTSSSPIVKRESQQKVKSDKEACKSKRDKYKCDARQDKPTNERKCEKVLRTSSSRDPSRSRSRSRSWHASPGPPQLERAVSPVRGKSKPKKESSEGFLELFSVKEELLVVSEAKDSSNKTMNIYGKSSKIKSSVSDSPRHQKVVPHQGGKKDCRFTDQDKKEKSDKKLEIGSRVRQPSANKSTSNRKNDSKKQSSRKESKTPNSKNKLNLEQDKNFMKSEMPGSNTEKEFKKTNQHHRDKSKSSTKSMEDKKNDKVVKRQVPSKTKKEDNPSHTDLKAQASSNDSNSMNDNQEETTQEFDEANVDSPDAILTPVSLSHFNQEDEESHASQSPKQSQHRTHLDSKSNHSSKNSEPLSAADPESFPFPPTPQKTPKPNSPTSCGVSTTLSPCPKTPVSPDTGNKCPLDNQALNSGTEIETSRNSNTRVEPVEYSNEEKDCEDICTPNTLTLSEECSLPKDVSIEEELSVQEKEKDKISPLPCPPKDSNCLQNEPPSPVCVSPLFPEKSVSTSKRACGRSSSTSSRCSSDEDSSSSSTNSSSSFCTSSEDDNCYSGSSNRRKRKRKHLKSSGKTASRKTPPRKLSLMHPPLSLSIGSPPKPPLLYSPMPSPTVNGFSSYANQTRLGLGVSSVPGMLAGKSSSLAPLSISVQHSPGYQMVSVDSMRSPTGVIRSPVGSGNGPSSSVMLKHYSTFPGPSSLSPTVGSSSLVPASKLSPQIAMKTENVFDKSRDAGIRSLEARSKSPNQPSFVSKMPIVDSKSRPMIDVAIAKDCNANNREKSNFQTILNKDDTCIQSEEKPYPYGLHPSHQHWNQDSNLSKSHLLSKEPNEMSVRAYLLSKPEMPNLKRNSCYSKEIRPESPPLPDESQAARDKQGLEKGSCTFAIEKRPNHRHTRPTENFSQFQPIEQQKLPPHHHKSGYHQARPPRPMRPGAGGGPPPQHTPAYWTYQQQHMPGLSSTPPRARSRFGGVAKPRGQSPVGHYSSGDRDHSRQHYSHHRGSSAAMTSGSSSPPPLLSHLDQPYGSDWWILVMQNGQAQAGNAQSLQLGGTVLNAQPK